MSNLKVFNRDMLSTLKEGEDFTGVILIKDYAEKPAKNSKPYIDGSLQADITVQFKAWNSSVAYTKMSKEEYRGTVAFVQGTVQSYMGMPSIIITDVNAVSDYKPADFFKLRYNTDSYFNALMKLFNSNTSDKCHNILSLIFTEDVKKRFMEEFAASSHHDNCLGGTLAHTYKMVAFSNTVVQFYPQLFSVKNADGTVSISKDKIDKFFLGVVLHDIGKIDEMQFGVYTPKSRVTHRILGLEYLNRVRKEIESAYGEVGFYDLESAVIQHHDEFDDKARTTLAYAVHLVDYFESSLMGLAQTVESALDLPSFNEEKREDTSVKFNDRYLYLS